MAARARETLQQMGVPDGFAPVRPEQQDAAFDFVTLPPLGRVHPVQLCGCGSYKHRPVSDLGILHCLVCKMACNTVRSCCFGLISLNSCC